ncbi:enoyl-CoA hydratase-related protein [Nocardia sp. NBC_01377]|uniref:enoyl-CoA hydratase/isomerase family protein n=1 Tax=Nocardia sp. NBC_01377 TaxID=2903595 RepID=UPI00325171F3
MTRNSAKPPGPAPSDQPSMSAAEELAIHRHGPVSVIELHRPDARNALTTSMPRDIGAAAETDPEIQVLVLTGAGDQAFCAGMDLRSFTDGTRFDTASEEGAAYQRPVRGELSVPVVAANGTAVGGGLELLLGADLIVASATAKFGFPEAKRGLFPASGGTFISTRLPLGIALEMPLTGNPITAQRGYEVGLINSVVPPRDVLSTALSLARQVADNAPLALTACKELVRLAVTDAAEATERLGYWQKAVFHSEDARAGARAFIEKRKPVWQGR